MNAGRKDRIDTVLRLAGALLRTVHERYNFDGSTGPCRLIEYERGSLKIVYVTYAIKPRSDRGAYIATGPKRLEIFYADGKVFEVAWNELGKRRKMRDKHGNWDRALEREAYQIAERSAD